MLFKPCIVIPVYNHDHVLAALLQPLFAEGLQVILVNDGSRPSCTMALQAIAQRHPAHCTLLQHAVNQGKGAAVVTGLQHAYAAGFSHALQIDADGQHTVADVPRFLSHASQAPDAMILGQPVYDASVPKGRLYGRYLTHIWVWINTLSFAIRDSMCGFRVYPLHAVVPVLSQCKMSQRMDFDTEVVVRLAWQGMVFINIPTRVSYPEDGISHFALWRDNILISRMHARLFWGMLCRLPGLLWARKRAP